MRWVTGPLSQASLFLIIALTHATAPDLFLPDTWGSKNQANAQSKTTSESSKEAPSFKLPPGVRHLKTGSVIEGTPAASKFIFDNGLQVIVLPDDRNPLATLKIKLDAGSNREKLGETGLAHFFEHMMFRKTKGTPEGHYDRTLAGVGGRGNAGTSTDYVVYYSRFPGPALEKMMIVESQRFKNLELSDPYFTTEKGAVISERRLNYENDPSRRAMEILRKITQRGTKYEWLTIGAKEDVQNMTIEAAREFYENYYTPDNAIVTVGGPFSTSEALQLVHKHFGDWKGKLKGKHARLPDDFYTRDLGKEFVCSEAVATQSFTMTYPSKETDFRSSVMADLFTQMLDDHPEGTFERRLVKNKLATGFGFYKTYWQKNNQPLNAIFILNKDQKFEAAQEFWQKAIDEVLKKPLDERARQRVLKQLAVREAGTAQKMTSLADVYEWSEFFYDDFLIEKKMMPMVKTISESAFRKWVRESLSPQKFYTTGVVPTGQAKTCDQLLAEQKSQEKKK